MAGEDELVFVPLGGVGEIGMNLALYGFGQGKNRSWLAVDVGQSFGHDDLPGVDAVLPDVRFLVERKKNLLGIVITHAHEDHFGGLFDLWPRLGVPVYMTPFTAGLLEAKRSGEHNAPKIPVTVVNQGESFEAGPFKVEFVPVSHSVPEANALAITTPAGKIVHTGDWKLDPTPGTGRATDENRLAELGREGVLALICDSTNAVREGISPSESEVALVLERMIAEAKHRVAVTTFASNISRIRSVAAAAQRAGRDVVIIGRAIRRAVDVATELGLLEGLPPFLDQDAYGYLPRERVVALMTGSQGEPRAALSRIASGDHRAVALSAGDRVIFSSRPIPGNERAIGSIINALVDLGAEVVTDRDGLVHTSGHPRRDELRQMYDWIKPQVLVPVHGEPLHLQKQAMLGRSVGIPHVVETRNGRMTRLWPGKPERLADVTSGRLFRDGNIVSTPDASGVADRRRLSFLGVISVSVVLSDSGEVLEDPALAVLGIPKADASGKLLYEIAQKAVDDALDGMSKARKRDASVIEETVRRTVRGEIETVWGKRPTVIVHVTHVSD
ncbi:ribonuclease J [Faunimonas pinastri]|uniref:Ribonuclease J n=1 Tax=Faunimonas pinastri TaxID=1855383 RepID=A0A1H9J8V6_9HYPH|nr:ribonuclease J [Faunimonas pinastri]SEQ83025.1 ribonuclease J [Faunimonas pinastri]